MGYYGFPVRETVAEKRARNARALQNFKKLNPQVTIKQIQVKGNRIGTSFWGKAWCDNLSHYADYGNRICRGKSYLKEGAVFDLNIQKGTVTGLVAGSNITPYHVTITIRPLTNNRLVKKIDGNIESLEELAEGKFPIEFGHIFLTRNHGLFPTSKEITFKCTCPDSAKMCKHISACFYAIGLNLMKNHSSYLS
ncbi:hypothetical protein DOK76_03295 [Vagococcus sp. DIV0080]|uniref:SWIM-type domain-containing protein n=1 Tax=Candidatus Vagococcus giribetii TaxID=2230876 RepID=A0ABS3HQQ0_9ENTE|nr:hypothetical protein [Vagococcus sp. DIV0080]MBO0476079.1 hypothetical protein [Vagococcus sp. DIV0080]